MNNAIYRNIGFLAESSLFWTRNHYIKYTYVTAFYMKKEIKIYLITRFNKKKFINRKRTTIFREKSSVLLSDENMIVKLYYEIRSSVSKRMWKLFRCSFESKKRAFYYLNYKWQYSRWPIQNWSQIEIEFTGTSGPNKRISRNHLAANYVIGSRKLFMRSICLLVEWKLGNVKDAVPPASCSFIFIEREIVSKHLAHLFISLIYVKTIVESKL